jgi:uncharacterized protein YjbI with pentapeptide repeats
MDKMYLQEFNGMISRIFGEKSARLKGFDGFAEKAKSFIDRLDAHEALLRLHHKDLETMRAVRERGTDPSLFRYQEGDEEILEALVHLPGFGRIDLRGADLHDANLLEINMRRADLRGADLREANLIMADLCLADLRGVDLRWANLLGADLRGANLCGAELRGANLCGTELRGVVGLNEDQIRSAIIDENTMLDPEFDDLKREILAAQAHQHPEPPQA